MKIVISGAGEMGSHLAKMLSGNGHDITVIDKDAKLLTEVSSLADVITVEGDATTFAILRKASVRKCDLFIAVDHIENDNVLSAIMAKQLGAKKSIARIDNNEYLEPNNKEMFINMGIDYLFYPRKGGGRRGYQPAWPHRNNRVCRLLEWQALAGRIPLGGDLSAGGSHIGISYRGGFRLEFPHRGNIARRLDHHPHRSRRIHGG